MTPSVIVRWPKSGSKEFKVAKLLEEMTPQEEVDMDNPFGVMFLPVTGPADARSVASAWHAVVYHYTMVSIETKLIQWPNGDYELLIWRKT